MRFDDVILAAIPLVPSAIAFFGVNDPNTSRLIMFSIFISVFGFVFTDSLIPVFAEYTLKRGLSGKDLGKKGTDRESIDVPEALGIVCGVVFLVCTISLQLILAKNDAQLVIYNSALFSICFMIFLGFLDDTLELKWRYKLILPTIASLPLLISYSGSTAMYIPRPFQSLLMTDGKLTTLGYLVDLVVVVDTEAHGAIVELGSYFLVFMGLQAVFCTNAINILAGINGLECGQAYIIGCSLLFFKLYEIVQGKGGEDEIFAVVLVIPFIATSLGLLRYNWYPAKVFVGDTFCYFAGMTFAVIGIHSHFSKTLLMLFIPQIINFIYSTPQLFKIIPCPRHRLPRVDPKTKLLNCSTFPCKAEEFKLFKRSSNDTECPNCTLICLVLRVCGPMNERSLTIVMLLIQIVCSVVVFYLRYFVLDD